MTGDATDAGAVRALVEGCDGIISALGPVSGRTDICSMAAGHVIAAGVKRYVAISGAGLDVPGDKKDLLGRIVSFLVSKLSPAVFEDKVREYALLAASGVDWTLVRPPQLVDRPGTGAVRMDLERSPGARIARDDLAAFLVRAVADETLIRKAPFVAG